jgi:CBS domain-containing protein
MKIKDIMTTDVRICSPGTNLAAAAALMLDGDCGILPVVDEGKLVGVVTDRDESRGSRARVVQRTAAVPEGCA